MEALLKNEDALDILSSISMAQFLVIAVVIIGVGVTIFKFRDNIKKFLEDYRHKANYKEDLMAQIKKYDQEIATLKKHHEEDITSFYNNQSKYRQQSLEKQKNYDAHFTSIDQKLDDLTNLILNHYEETKTLKRNELREKLINSYRHYCSPDNNPSQSWNEMESEAFWELFHDYEALGGNGYMHRVVKPEMEKLEVIKIF